MKTSPFAHLVTFALPVIASGGGGPSLVITSFEENGLITWSNCLANASYEVQWTPSLDGEWSSSWDGLRGLRSANPTLSASVPLFYRVVATLPVLYPFPPYFPTDPNVYGTKTYRVTNYLSHSDQTVALRYLDFVRVPYRSGTLYGVRLARTNASPLEGTYVYNDGTSVKALGAEGWFVSTDAALTAYPSVWERTAIWDGEIIQGPYYLVKHDLSQAQARYQKKLFTVNDVSVPAGTFIEAIAKWDLDAEKPFVILDFHGAETDLGVQLPSGVDTGGSAVRAITVEAVNTGIIVDGRVDPNSGVLEELWVLTTTTHD